ncbi:MAG TPA: DUF669 domain-containing protein [Planctomycetaceae bacterium]|nr:DUF669 domain-containing protein [Planctomycetaceae bacterium]
MGKLTDILRNGDADRLRRSWETSQAAGDFGLLPPGEYVCLASKGELESSRSKRTPGYKLEFSVIDGEFKGRKVWHDCWITEAAMPQTKRDLGKLGVTSLDQLERPLPPGIRCKVRVVIRKDDDGNQHNRVRMFEVVGIDTPKADPFAPAVSTEQSSGGAAS